MTPDREPAGGLPTSQRDTAGGNSWGYMATGPEFDYPCWTCGHAPTRVLHATRGFYCERHCRSFAHFGTAVSIVIVLSVVVGMPLLFVGIVVGWWGT